MSAFQVYATERVSGHFVLPRVGGFSLLPVLDERRTGERCREKLLKLSFRCSQLWLDLAGRWWLVPWASLSSTVCFRPGLQLVLTSMTYSMPSCTAAISEEIGHFCLGFGSFAHSFTSHTNPSSSTFLLLTERLFQYCFTFFFHLYLRLLKADCSCRGHVLLLEYKSKVFPY